MIWFIDSHSKLNKNKTIFFFLNTHTNAGNPRNKCALQPGHSLMDWVRLGSSNYDLAGTKSVIRPISYEELAKHNKVDDCWLAIRGKVFNVTKYMEFHPGGMYNIISNIIIIFHTVNMNITRAQHKTPFLCQKLTKNPSVVRLAFHSKKLRFDSEILNKLMNFPNKKLRKDRKTKGHTKQGRQKKNTPKEREKHVKKDKFYNESDTLLIWIFRSECNPDTDNSISGKYTPNKKKPFESLFCTK